MSAHVIPSQGWILVRRNLPAKQTASGILIPETARARHPGITPGEASKVEVLAVNPDDAEIASGGNRLVFRHDTYCAVPFVGDTVFVLANNENMVPVVTDEYGQVEMANGWQVPDTYLFKLTAVAGRTRREGENANG